MDSCCSVVLGGMPPQGFWCECGIRSCCYSRSGWWGQVRSIHRAAGMSSRPLLFQQESKLLGASVRLSLATAAVAGVTARWGPAGSVEHYWGHVCSWVPSSAVARGRGAAVVLAAEVGPQLRMLRLHRYSQEWGAGVVASGEFPEQLPSASSFYFFKNLSYPACCCKQTPDLSHS